MVKVVTVHNLVPRLLGSIACTFANGLGIWTIFFFTIAIRTINVHLYCMMQVFHSEEAVAKEASNKVMKRFTERMSKAEAESKVTHCGDGRIHTVI